MLLEKMPMDRVLYAANYPFEDRAKGLMEGLKESGVVGREEGGRIAAGNAGMLFGLKGTVAAAAAPKVDIGQALH